MPSMSKKKKRKKIYEAEVIVTYKPVKNTSDDMMEPVVAWHIKVDGKKFGTAPTLSGVAKVLEQKGYKAWAFRRNNRPDDHPEYKATVIYNKKD
jgi:hypothetical protein